MKRIDTRGFTVVEVMIFLSISGLLIVMAFTGTNTAIARTRFNDSVQTVKLFFQQQYSDVLNGLNDRDSSVACTGSDATSVSTGQEPGESNCLLMGKLVTWDSAGGNEFVVYPVVGTEPSASTVGMSEADILEAYQLKIVAIDTTTRRQQISWSATITGACADIDLTTVSDQQILGKCVADKPVDSYLILRSPRTGEIMTFVFDGGWGLPRTTQVKQDVLDGPGYMNFNRLDLYRQTANICVQSATLTSLYGGIQVGGQASAGQVSIAGVADLDQTGMEAACGH